VTFREALGVALKRVFGSSFSHMTKINRLKNFSHTLFGG
jgi:hypothetical protein